MKNLSMAEVLVVFAITFIILYLPIYLAHRRNKKYGRSPKIWVAALLSCIPAGGILYVGGPIPGLIVYSLFVLLYLAIGYPDAILKLTTFPLIFLCGLWAYKKKIELEQSTPFWRRWWPK